LGGIDQRECKDCDFDQRKITEPKRLREFLRNNPRGYQPNGFEFNEYRKTLKGNFEEKVQKMNEATAKQVK
jgi:hypothetical protein